MPFFKLNYCILFSVKKAAGQVYSEVSYAKTSISTQVYEVIHICKVKGGLVIDCGDARIGKTKAISKYAADNLTNTIVIIGNSFDTTTRAMIEMLAEELGIDEEYSFTRGDKNPVRLLVNAYDSGDYSINGLALWAKRMDVERLLAFIADCEVREIDVAEFYVWKIFYNAQSLENRLRRALTE